MKKIKFVRSEDYFFLTKLNFLKRSGHYVYKMKGKVLLIVVSQSKLTSVSKKTGYTFDIAIDMNV